MPLAITIRGLGHMREQLQNVARGFERDRLEGMSRAVQETRNEFYRSLSAHKVSAGFWGYRSPDGPVLAARTGRTRRALPAGRVWRVGAVTFGVVGHDSPHVLALEEGRTITPKNGEYLRVPTENALTGAGQDRHEGHSVRGLPGFFGLKSRTGRLWVAKWTGPGKAPRFLDLSKGARSAGGKRLIREQRGAGSAPWELWYLLVPSVQMPEKRVLRGVFDRMGDRYARIFDHGYQATVGRHAA